MRKFNFATIIMVGVISMLLLCSCSSNSPIRSEVTKAYNLDNDGEKLIAFMFEAFDNGFNDLCELESINEQDLYNYATKVNSIHEAYISYNFSKKYEVKLDSFEGDAQKTAGKVLDDWAFMHLNAMDLSFMVYSSSEKCFESAVTLVNSCSNFFYGTERISDEDLNKISEKLK